MVRIHPPPQCKFNSTYDNYEKYYSKYDVDTYSIVVGATGMLSKSTGKTITRSEFLELVKEYDEELIELQNK